MRMGVSAVPSTRRSTVACRMAPMRGLHGRTAMNVPMASARLKPRHQYMYASAVAGALPRPAQEVLSHSMGRAFNNSARAIQP